MDRNRSFTAHDAGIGWADERNAGRVVAARSGDEGSFDALTAPHARELHVHCYRMLGSLRDAEDAYQVTVLRAWRHLGGFEARSSFRAWLYRIATNVCLAAAAARKPQPLPPAPYPTTAEEDSIQLSPYPDALFVELPSPA